MTRPDPDWPMTLDEVASRVLGWLSDEIADSLRSTDREALYMFHFAAGTGIRNELGLRADHARAIA